HDSTRNAACRSTARSAAPTMPASTRSAGEIREGWLEGPGGLSRGLGRDVPKATAAASADAVAPALVDARGVVEVSR
ncbi:MAG: hypothetical protein ACKOHK_11025, partial [Planctomycetia bacterium]